jgi:hypothetical protein
VAGIWLHQEFAGTLRLAPRWRQAGSG